MRQRKITYKDGTAPRCEITRKDDGTVRCLEWFRADGTISHRDWHRADGTVESTCWLGEGDDWFWTDYSREGKIMYLRIGWHSVHININFYPDGSAREILTFKKGTGVDRVISYSEVPDNA